MGHEPSSRLDAIDDRDGSSTAAVMRRFGERLLLCRFLDAGNNEALGTLS
jgi:hypothetical protein